MRIIVALLLTVAAVTSTSADERVSFPEDYRETFAEYLSLDRIQNPDQFIRLYANDIAMQGRDESGELPDGAVVVGEVFSVETDEDGNVKTSLVGRRIEDQLLLIAVIEKRSEFGETSTSPIKTGDWDFAAFKPNGDTAPKNLDECRACHAPLANSDFLFSIEHLPARHKD